MGHRPNIPSLPLGKSYKRAFAASDTMQRARETGSPGSSGPVCALEATQFTNWLAGPTACTT